MPYSVAGSDHRHFGHCDTHALHVVALGPLVGKIMKMGSAPISPGTAGGVQDSGALSRRRIFSTSVEAGYYSSSLTGHVLQSALGGLFSGGRQREGGLVREIYRGDGAR
jgi:hypothetical protein